MASNRSLQLLRNNTLFNTLAEAKAAMSANTVTTQDGVAVLGRYGSGNDIKTVLGIKHVVSGVTGMTFFENSSAIDALQVELDATQASAGLGTDGSFAGPSGGTWTSGAKTLAEAIDKLEKGLESISASSVSGDSKVVIDVTQENGNITATSANLTGVKLEGLSATADTKISSADTLGDALGKLQGQIDSMDKAASAVDGQVVTTVSEADGKVTETKANVKDLQLGGYSKDTAATGDIASADTINTALSKLENKVGANEIKNTDKSIVVTPDTTNGGTDIKVNIKSGEKVIKLDNDGIYTDLDLVKITTGLPAEVKERYQLLASDDSQIGVNIDIAKDSHIVSITYITDSADAHYQNLEYVYIDASGNTQTEYVDISSLVLEAEFASGVTVTDHVAHGVVDPTSEAFLTVGADGFKLSGVQNAIDSAITALDVTDTAVAGEYVSQVSETDGKIAVTRANVSEAVLNNYERGTNASAVTSSDTVNQAISKLENQVDAAKAAATTKVVEGTDAGNNMTITPTTSSTDGSVTYTVNLTDVASKTDLDTLSGKTVTVIDGSDSDIDVMVSHVAADDGTVKYTISASGNATTIKVGQDIDEDGALSADSTISQALAALYNTAKENKVVGKEAIAVGAPTSGGTEVSLKLDGTKQGTGSEKTGTDNALTQSGDGLFLSTIWDCGTYDVAETQP